MNSAKVMSKIHKDNAAENEKEKKKRKKKVNVKKEITEKSPSKTRITALKAVAVTCAVLSFILLMVVVGLGVTHGEIPVCSEGYRPIPRNLENPSVFDDLTPTEYSAVSNFLLSQPTLNLVPTENATVNSSYIYMIDLLMPLKDAVLLHLDRGDKQPERSAKVVLYRGNLNPPKVDEIHVGPLPYPKYYRKVTNPSYTTNKIPFSARPVDNVEYKLVYDMLKEVSIEMYPLLMESYGLSYHNCTRGIDCLTFFENGLRDTGSGQRKTWFCAYRDVEGHYLHPLGLEIQINHISIDTNDWHVTRIVYNGQMFYSAETLMKNYQNDWQFKKIKLSSLGFKEHLFSSYIRRGKGAPPPSMQGPRLVEPGGHRYQIVGGHVRYIDWNFNIRSRTSSGLQLYDIRFQGERIAYEISIQDALVLSSGFGPSQISSFHYGSSHMMGAKNYALVPGVDCPGTAAFLNAMHFVNGDKTRHIKNSICIFENNPNIPLRRHYSDNYAGSYSNYGGLIDYNLVVRTISNIWNYDYIFDYIFHANGAIEVAVSVTGYVRATFALNGEMDYGYMIHNQVMADMNQHLFHYKVDLDVNGPENTFATLDITTEYIRNPWYRDVNISQMRFDSHDAFRELDSVKNKNINSKYDIIYNKHATSKFGSSRAFRILNFAKSPLLMETSPYTKAGSWARHPIAVTQFKDTEEMSTSIYAQNEPWEPVVDFERFLLNNESIIDADIVAWVTIGGFHIPHTEDVPSMPTVGGQYKFFILPFNYFTECPSVTSYDIVRVIPKGGSDVKVETYGTSFDNMCVQKVVGPYKYDGNY